VRGRRKVWQKFLLDNVQWMLASIVLAFGLWIIAALQTDPVRQREIPVQGEISILLDENMIVTNDVARTPTFVTLRAPGSVLDNLNALRADQIKIVADMRGLESGSFPVELPVELDADLTSGLRGQVVSIRPAELTIRLDVKDEAVIPVRVEIAQEPPSGFSYPPPSCNLVEVTATGPASALTDVTARARLDLSEQRNPVTLNVPLEATNANNQVLSNVVLETNTLECQVDITQREGVSELGVVPDLVGDLPQGYIFESITIEPDTVVVTGQPSAIRLMDGKVSTEPIDISSATGDVERIVSVILPEGVRLLPNTQTINVAITIGTLPGSSRIDEVPIQLMGLRAGLEAEILPNAVTVLAVGPQPIVQELSDDDFRIVIDLSELEAGSYQRVPTATILAESGEADISLTLQPAEVSVTLTAALDDDSLDQTSTPANATPTADPTVR
jgi:YbbR domain-containing protein